LDRALALFPDRIINKNSADPAQTIINAIKPSSTDSIIAGELVVARENGSAQIYTLDSNNVPVAVGPVNTNGGTSPSVILNFNDPADSYETPHFYSSAGYGIDLNGVFGGRCINLVADQAVPYRNFVRVDPFYSPAISDSTWTLSFWIKAPLTTGSYDTGNDGDGNKIPNACLVFSLDNYHYGPGAFNIYLDGGTLDSSNGIGTSTSETQDIARGAICFGLGGMWGTHGSSDPLIPLTGEIVTSRNTSVTDDAWHYVTFSHEGQGFYSCFIDGDLKQRKRLTYAINHSDSGTANIAQPSGLILGGNQYTNDNTSGAGDVIHGFAGRLDDVSLHVGNSLYRGLRSFDVPTTEVDDSLVLQPALSLETLLDTNIESVPSNGDVLQWNSTDEAWENSPAPAYNISGNDLRDLRDVNLPANASIGDKEVLSWDSANGEWVASTFQLADTDLDTSGGLVEGAVIRYDGTGGTSWVAEKLSISDLAEAPFALSDFTQDLDLSNYSVGDLDDVVLTAPTQGDVLVWNSLSSKFENLQSPPANVSSNVLSDLMDVNTFAQAGIQTQTSFVYLSWNRAGQVWEPGFVDYDDMINTPTKLSDFNADIDINDLNNTSFDPFARNSDFASLDRFGDVSYGADPADVPLESQVLVWRTDEWVPEYGPPANITTNSIGDLSDVTFTPANGQAAAELTIDGLGEFRLEAPLAASNIDYLLRYEQEVQGVGLAAIRPSDSSGSALYVSRGYGIDMRSDVNFFRLRGKPDVTTNRPELRFETGDSFAAAPTGNFISLKMPSTVLEDQTYYLPQEDGDVGDVLATNGAGALAWVARIQNNTLGALNDVDLQTQLPVGGSALVYNSTSGLWVPGSAGADLSTSSINDLSDVNYSGTPGIGQGLLWDGTEWTADDLSFSINTTILGSDDIGTAPTTGQFLRYDGTDFNGITLGAVAISNDYADLTNKPTTFSGDYDDLTNKPSIPDTINDLSDVDTNSKSTGQSLVWSGLKWEPTDVAIDLSTESIDELSDVDTTTTAPTTNQALVWNGSSWVPGDVALDLSSESIDQLQDVSINSGTIASGQGLVWDGSDFTNQAVLQTVTNESVGELADVDTTTTAPVGGQALVWDGSNWVPRTVVISGPTGSAISQAATETQTSDADGEIALVDLGTSGTLVSVQADSAAWVTVYSSAAARTADASRLLEEDPEQGSGVLAEYVLTASTTVLTTPSTNYFNSEAVVSESIYVLVRDPETGAALNNVGLTVKAFAISGYNAVSGGAFGSG
jgi:hypothetical protein